VVVLDLAMPDMDGRETYERLLAMDPGVKVILASGYAAGRDAVELLNRGVRAFIEKPYRMEELNATIERVAAGGRTP
jgi:DNA-binding NtrC family response regulator